MFPGYIKIGDSIEGLVSNTTVSESRNDTSIEMSLRFTETCTPSTASGAESFQIAGVTDQIRNSNSDTLFTNFLILLEKPKYEWLSPDAHIQEITTELQRNRSEIFSGKKETGANVFHTLASNPQLEAEGLAVFELGVDRPGAARKHNLLRVPAGPRGLLPIHTAVYHGYTKMVSAQLEIDPALAKAPDANGNTPIHYASITGQPTSTTMLKLLLDHMDTSLESVPVNKNKETPLHSIIKDIFVCFEPKEKMRILLQFFRHCGETKVTEYLDSSGYSVLHNLCNKKHSSWKHIDNEKYESMLEVMRMLAGLPDLVNLASASKQKWLAIHLLCIRGNYNCLEILLSHPHTCITSVDVWGRMAIHYAASNDYTHKSHLCVEMLSNWKNFKNKLTHSNPDIDEEECANWFREYLLETSVGRKPVYFEGVKNGKNATAAPNRQLSNTHNTKSREYLLEGTEPDIEHCTALILACLAKSVPSARSILLNMCEAGLNFQQWFDSSNPSFDANNNSLKLVYKYTPEALDCLFDRAVVINYDQSTRQQIVVKVHTCLITALLPMREVEVNSEVQCLKDSSQWPCLVEEKLLLHKLTQIYLGAFWEKTAIPRLFATIFNWLFFVMYLYISQGEFNIYKLVAAWILLIPTVCEILADIFQLRHLNKLDCPHVVDTIRAIMGLLSILGRIILYFRPSALSVSDLTRIAISCGAILYGYEIIIKLPLISMRLGTPVVYVKKIVQKLPKYLPMFAIPVAVFQTILCQYINKTDSSSIITRCAKVFGMSNGEYELSDMLQNSAQYGDPWLNSLITSIVFVVFCLCFMVIHFVFAAVVFQSTLDMKERADLHRTKDMISHTKHLQRTCLYLDWFTCRIFDWQNKMFVSKAWEPTLRRRSTAPSVVFHINIGQRFSIWDTLQIFVKGFSRFQTNHKYSGFYLPQDLRQKLLEEYQANQ